MPNLTPAQPVAQYGPFGDNCGTNTCVNPERRDDGVHVTSTIVGNNGLVVFTQEEWDAFIPDVKAGRWDHTTTGVPISA
jgi:hypothetical protein